MFLTKMSCIEPFLSNRQSDKEYCSGQEKHTLGGTRIQKKRGQEYRYRKKEHGDKLQYKSVSQKDSSSIFISCILCIGH